MEESKAYIGRVAGYYVYVSNTTSENDGYVCYHDESTEQSMLAEDLHFNCSVRRRYVIYQNERRQDV